MAQTVCNVAHRRIIRFRSGRRAGCCGVILLAILNAACGGEAVTRVLPTPALAPLEILSRIETSGDLIISDLSGSVGCELVVMDGLNGTAFNVGASGQALGKWVPPIRLRNAQVEHSGQHAYVWSEEPPRLYRLDTRLMEATPVEVPTHPWGKRPVGPVVWLTPSRLAMAAVSGKQPRREPVPWVASPLLQVMELDQGRVMSVDELDRLEGEYLSWRWSRIDLGRWADTVVAVNHMNARVTLYDVDSGGTIAREIPMGHYFESLAPREEVWRPEWIQVGADIVAFYDIAHVEAAAIDPSGTIFAVRNYDAKWSRRSNPYVPTQGAWQVTERGLEVYGRDGTRLGAFLLPSDQPEWVDGGWISADEHGRLFIPDGSGAVVVVRSPVAEESACHEMDDWITVAAVESHF